MGEKLKIVGMPVGVIVGIVLFVFLMGLGSLGYYKFFAPKFQNVEREIFEETQSFVHGKIQDLAKYYDEYNQISAIEDKETIRQLIIMRFAEFDETKIRSTQLRNFLTSMRGY